MPRTDRRQRAQEAHLTPPDPLAIRNKNAKPARLPRRSAEEIAGLLGKIVLLVKTHKDGMRAEEIRKRLGMQTKEMPRILKEGIATKKLTSKGRKRRRSTCRPSGR
jgi:hypothetical protein